MKALGLYLLYALLKVVFVRLTTNVEEFILQLIMVQLSSIVPGHSHMFAAPGVS